MKKKKQEKKQKKTKKKQKKNWKKKRKKLSLKKKKTLATVNFLRVLVYYLINSKMRESFIIANNVIYYGLL